MGFDAGVIQGAIVMGLAATLSMDLWNLFLLRTFRLPSLNYCLLGRWVRHIPEGTLRHASIAAAPKKSGECPVGWIAHYSIGVMLALGFVLLVSADWLARPTLLPALLYGITTLVFPILHSATIARAGCRQLTNAESDAGPAEKPGDPYSIRSRVVSRRAGNRLLLPGPLMQRFDRVLWDRLRE